jgi:hypothetical protein
MFRQAGGVDKWIQSPHRIKINNLSFAYEDTNEVNRPISIGDNGIASGDEKLILNNISITIPAGGYALGVVGIIHLDHSVSSYTIHLIIMHYIIIHYIIILLYHHTSYHHLYLV